MGEHEHIDSHAVPTGDRYQGLARWLQQLLQEDSSNSEDVHDTSRTGTGRQSAQEDESHLGLLLDSGYHPTFYQQLPDFIMALLNGDSHVAGQYAPLLYHLAGCSSCHESYVDLYDAMRAAVYPQGVRPILGQGTRTLAGTPPRMLSHLCETLISQAGEILHEAHREHRDEDAQARLLLQLALRMSAHIQQSSVRMKALHDLVRVATLFDGAPGPETEEKGHYTYTPILTGAGSGRGSGKTVRRSETSLRSPQAFSDQPVLRLHSQSLEGTITQEKQVLVLRLQNLGPELRERFVTIDVRLGLLLEPVRWLGGNPRAIRSTTRVDAEGNLMAPLGETELQLRNSEDRNLLEALFLLLEVRVADDQEG